MKQRLIAIAATTFAAAILWSGAGTAPALAGNDWEFTPDSTQSSTTGGTASPDGNDWEFAAAKSPALGHLGVITSRMALGNDWE
ncbi:MAG TPA: hypothetical protein VH419_02775 [Nocardioidaceae bacterium]|jgi:hypothetical protein